MSVNVTFNGVVYIIPETGEVGWGGNTTTYLVAVAAGALQKTGGSFSLSAETDFGASFGLRSLYYRSRSSNVAAAGILRLNNNSDAISWRNAANSADLSLFPNASNLLTFNGSTVYVIGAGTITNADIAAGAGIVYSKLNLSNSIVNADVNTSAAIAFSKMAAMTGNALPKTDASGFVIASGWSFSAVGNITTGSNDELRFQDGGINYVSIKAPAVVTTHTYDLPVAPGTAGQVLSWQAGGQLTWINAAGGGTINSGTQYQLAHYAANGTTLSGLTLITASRALASDVNGLPVASATTATELGYVSGVTSAIQTQLGTKLNLSGGTMTGALLALPGTALLPGIAFDGDTNTGLFSSVADALNVSAGGSSRLLVNSTVVRLQNGDKLELEDGLISDLAWRFTNDTNTGAYLSASDTMNFTAGGADIFRIDTDFRVLTGHNLVLGTTTRILGEAGSLSLPTYGFSGDLNTGIRHIGADSIGMVTGGADKLTIGATDVTVVGGAIVAPNSRLSNTTNQLTLGTTNTTIISSVAPSASRVYTIPDAGVDTSFVMGAGTQTINGAKTFGSTVTAPSGTLTNTTNQFILGTTNTSTISATAPSASRVLTIPDPGADANFIMSAGTQTIGGPKTFSGVTAFSAGSASAPSIHFGDSDTGIYSDGTANTIRFTMGGTQSLVINTTDVVVANGLVLNSNKIIPNADNTYLLGQSGARYTEVWAANGTIQTSMGSTKTNVTVLAETDPTVICKVPQPATFTRPGEDVSKVRLGWLADNLPETAHPVLEDGTRDTECVYTDSILAMHSLALRRDFNRLAALEAENIALKARLDVLEAQIAQLLPPQ